MSAIYYGTPQKSRIPSYALSEIECREQTWDTNVSQFIPETQQNNKREKQGECTFDCHEVAAAGYYKTPFKGWSQIELKAITPDPTTKDIQSIYPSPLKTPQKSIFNPLISTEIAQFLSKAIANVSANQSKEKYKSSPIDKFQSSPTSQSLPDYQSLSHLLSLHSNITNTFKYSVIKVQNIHWDTKISELKEMLKSFHTKVPYGHTSPEFTQSIHIIMHHVTGRTQTEAFIEFPRVEIAAEALQFLQKGVHLVRGRHVIAKSSTQSELIQTMFPNWQGSITEDGKFYGAMIRDSITFNEFVDVTHRATITNACNAKKGRKSNVDRPFESVISIISKIPWFQPCVITFKERENLFELVKSAVKSRLTNDFGVGFTNPDELLDRLIRASLCVPLFSTQQKNQLLVACNMKCPTGLERFVVLFDKTKVETSSGNICSTDDHMTYFQLASRACELEDLQYSLQLRLIQIDYELKLLSE